MNRCAEHRARALDFVLGDLAGLERTRMEAHLDRCDGCREVAGRLSAAFTAAKRWPPESSARELEQLIGRLEPYFGGEEAPREPWFVWSGSFKAILTAAAVTAGIVFWASYSKDSSYSKDQVTPAPVVAVAPIAAQEEPAPAPEIVRLTPRPNLKLIAGGGWDGKIGGESEEHTSIVMSRGFAMIDFEGGAGRKLWVGAPNAAIEVVGTRFFVDTAKTGLTTIGVIAGKVVVSAPSGRATISAGQRRAFGEGDKNIHSAAENFAADPFLERSPAREKLAVATTKPAVIAPPVNAVSKPVLDPLDPLDPLAELAAAQRLARGEDPKSALAKYDALLEELDPEAPLAPLVRYERARLLAFVLHEKSRGALELHAVADSGRGEASLQAKLSLCELRLADDRADAARCLEELRARGHDALSTEIDRLFVRWNLPRDHKY